MGTAGERGDNERGEEDKLTHIISPSLDLLVESVLIFIPKGRVPDQQDVEDDTCTGDETWDQRERVHCWRYEQPQPGDWPNSSREIEKLGKREDLLPD